MSRLLVLLPLMLWFAWAERSDKFVPPSSLADALVSLLLLTGGFALVVALVRLVALRVVKSDGRQQTRRLRTYRLVLSLANPLLIAWYGVSLYWLGWGETMDALLTGREWSETFRLPGTILGALPAYLAWAAVWWAEYPVYRQRREATLLIDVELGKPIVRPPSLRRFVRTNLRHELLFFLAPVLVLLFLRDGLAYAAETTGLERTPLVETLFTFGPLALVLTLAPLLMPRVLRTSPLPAGPLRDRLDRLCRRSGVKVRNVLVWHTDLAVANALVVGVIPGLRTVILSDLLLGSLDDEQVEAVFAHELGHLRHRHLIWYVVFIAAMLLFFVGPATSAELAARRELATWSLPSVPAWVVDAALGVGSLLLMLGIFGLLSRLFERQADVFAARAMQSSEADGGLSPPIRPGEVAVGPGGAQSFASALFRTASINHMVLDRPGSTRGLPWRTRLMIAWQRWRDFFHHYFHGTIPQRIAYLQHLARDPGRTPGFDRFMAGVRAALLLAVAGNAAWLIWNG